MKSRGTGNIMSLREKIGQMVMAGFPSTDISEDYKKLVREYRIGNAILFSHNMKSTEQVRALCSELQVLFREGTGQPGFISVDQEGGVVSRLPSDAVILPGAMAVSATGDARNAYTAGEIVGAMLRTMGINMNLAPVMDINSNRNNPVIGVRSFGDTKERVALFGIEMMRGLEKGGVLPVLKHFPGHGDTAVDSHVGLPLIEKAEEELETFELAPFRAAIENGAKCVMTSHILFPSIESGNVPATMSGTIITNILKGKLGFDGLIISDCLEMDAVAKFYGTAKGAVEAIKAGVHIVCVSHTAKKVAETVLSIEEAVRSGELREERIDEAVEKILEYKRKYAACSDVNEIPKERIAELREQAQRISRQSITLVRCPGGTLPSVGRDTLFAGCYANRATMAGSPVNTDFSFSGYMAERFGGGGIITPLNPSESDMAEVLELARQYRTVVFGTFNGCANPGQLALANRLCEENENVIVVALRNPYDLDRIDKRSFAIATYEYTTLAFESLAEVLEGSVAPTGRLPVSISEESL